MKRTRIVTDEVHQSENSFLINEELCFSRSKLREILDYQEIVIIMLPMISNKIYVFVEKYFHKSKHDALILRLID